MLHVAGSFIHAGVPEVCEIDISTWDGLRGLATFCGKNGDQRYVVPGTSLDFLRFHRT